VCWEYLGVCLYEHGRKFSDRRERKKNLYTVYSNRYDIRVRGPPIARSATESLLDLPREGKGRKSGGTFALGVEYIIRERGNAVGK